MERRNEDLAILIGAALVGAWLGNLPAELPWPTLLLALGLLLLLGVLVQRIRADSPPSVRGDIGLRILDPEFSGGTVSFYVALRAPTDPGLWIVCNAPIITSNAGLRIWREGEQMPAGKVIQTFEYQRFAFIWFSNIDEETGKPQRAEVQVVIAARQPLKRIRVRSATRRNVRWITAKINAANSRLP